MSGSEVYLNLTTINALLNAPLFMLNQTQQIQKMLFEQQAQQYINFNGKNNTMLVEVTSNLDPGSNEAWQLLDVLEQKVDRYIKPLSKTGEVEGVYVTGLTALFKDSSDHMYKRVPLMLSLAVVLIFITLTILFRSLILPAKAILTIAGSILFGLGALVFVFQMGNFQHIQLFGVTLWQAEVVSLTYFIPVFLFTIILGLGMDYSIFIISRIREEFDKGADMHHAVGLGLSKTAGVVTSAATIMTVTFMVFALAPMLILKMMGLAMAIAIVVDATVARIILLPSAMELVGVYNFWLPKWLDKILPKIKIDH